jgi:anti-sigma B factor antagonist
MHLQVQQHEREGVVVLDLEGAVVLGPEDSLLRETLLALLKDGRRNVILNLSGVSEIDSAAFGTLVYCAERFREAGGRLVLSNFGASQTSLSDILRTTTELNVYANEQDALNSFVPERAMPRYDILEFVQNLNKADDHEQVR